METQNLHTWADIVVERFMPTGNYDDVDQVDDCYNQEYCEPSRPEIKELRQKDIFYQTLILLFLYLSILMF